MNATLVILLVILLILFPVVLYLASVISTKNAIIDGKDNIITTKNQTIERMSHEADGKRYSLMEMEFHLRTSRDRESDLKDKLSYANKLISNALKSSDTKIEPQ